MKSGLAGRVALVTGGNQGIGAATARALAAEGAHVFIAFFRPPISQSDSQINAGIYAAEREKSAGGVIADCAALGVKAGAFEADLSDPQQIPALFEACEGAFGPAEILINNAATWQADTFVPPAIRTAQVWPPSDMMGVLDAASIDFHFAVNARCTALMMAEFARRYFSRGATWGRIINLTTGGSAGFPGEVSYGASKAALESYTRAAAVELGPFGITVNCVCPGPTQTGWIAPEHESELIAQTPLRRIGQPEDVADAIVLLASDSAGWLTGQIIHASGGHGL